VTEQLKLIEGDPNGTAGLSLSWVQFIPDYMNQVVTHSRGVMASMIQDVKNVYDVAKPPAGAATVLKIVKEMETAAAAITMPYSTV
jgi:hypothetical protein